MKLIIGYLFFFLAGMILKTGGFFEENFLHFILAVGALLACIQIGNKFLEEDRKEKEEELNK